MYDLHLEDLEMWEEGCLLMTSISILSEMVKAHAIGIPMNVSKAYCGWKNWVQISMGAWSNVLWMVVCLTFKYQFRYWMYVDV